MFLLENEKPRKVTSLNKKNRGEERENKDSRKHAKRLSKDTEQQHGGDGGRDLSHMVF